MGKSRSLRVRRHIGHNNQGAGFQCFCNAGGVGHADGGVRRHDP